ncbi:preprotein translocase subunit YajC [Mycoplasmopsis pullorum]|uniref:preprotein translocase subunit YajC n=1 Tax=Mycoplasmopsis pullorum TaxID=48003 RepID=UPI00111B9F8D|nr:preprotein translocase subunit YajC [Mycoplasmopsis pullorum]TNK83937.1 preprotein translocase subunit YajC [Mycoplasmopsis pullorum]TNK92598.1 preprotein translocase subunit YajC [Mycoplasmopsis pullorum]
MNQNVITILAESNTNTSSTSAWAYAVQNIGVWVLGGLILIYLIFVIAVFPYLRKKRYEKDQKRKEELIASIKVDDEVLLASGMFGIVKEKQGQILFVEIADNTVVKVNKNYILGFYNEDIAKRLKSKTKKGKKK